jgi:hypothetical protein
MAQTVEDKYWKVVGTELLEDEDAGKVRHYLKLVADYQGTPAPPSPFGRTTYDTPIAQRQPEGTIIKITITTNITRQVTLNPTS